MPKEIYLVFSDLYRDKIYNSSIYNTFSVAMEMHGTKVELFREEDFGEIPDAKCLHDSLYISDRQEVINRLRDKGCYTIACYHENGKELLSGTQYAIEGIESIDWDYLHKVHQRYCGIPWDITETKRCLIKEMGPDDLDELHALYADARVTRYTEKLFCNKEEGNGYIIDYIEKIYKYFGFGTWLIRRKEDGVLIGRAGFHYRPGYEEVELGFVIGYPYWRNGYAYEVCRHLLDLGKTEYEFEKVQALVDENNRGSVQLLKKLGFCYVGNVFEEGQEYQRFLYE